MNKRLSKNEIIDKIKPFVNLHEYIDEGYDLWYIEIDGDMTILKSGLDEDIIDLNHLMKNEVVVIAFYDGPDYGYVFIEGGLEKIYNHYFEDDNEK